MRHLAHVRGGVLALAGMVFGASLASAAGDPVAAQSKAGPCRMTIYGEGQFFRVEVTGLASGEALDVTSISEGEVINHSTNAEGDGSYEAVLIPLVQGKSFGNATYIVSGSRCRIEASYRWHE